MNFDILNGAATLEVGNPNKAKGLVAQNAVVSIDENNQAQMLYAYHFGQFVSAVEGVVVNDKDNPDALAVWELWDAIDAGGNIRKLFEQFLDLDQDTVAELRGIFDQARATRYKAPVELQTSDESELDPN